MRVVPCTTRLINSKLIWTYLYFRDFPIYDHFIQPHGCSIVPCFIIGNGKRCALICCEIYSEQFFLHVITHRPRLYRRECYGLTLCTILYDQFRIAGARACDGFNPHLYSASGHGPIRTGVAQRSAFTKIIHPSGREIKHFAHPPATGSNKIVHRSIVNPSRTRIQCPRTVLFRHYFYCNALVGSIPATD